MEYLNNENKIKLLQQQIEELKEENVRITELAYLNAETLRVERAGFQDGQQRFRTVFECSPIGNKIIDKDLKILQANMAMVKLLGYTHKDEIIGTEILQYTPDAYLNDWKFLQQQLWGKNSDTFSLETALVCSNGTLIRCRVTSILFLDQGETLGYTSIEDITDQYLLRQQKEDFISVASHELKTPVTSLKGSIQLINRLLKPGLLITETISTLANKALFGVNRLTHLIDNLLSTTSLEQGQLPLNNGWFEIAAMVDICCDHALLQGKYFLTFTGNPGLRVHGDQNKIEQVLVNMISNAVKYAPDSTEIILDAKQQDGGVKISIIDKGKGISTSTLPYLFDRYYQVNDQVLKNESGLGLGLYICSEIIRRHGGEIGVESVENEGSTFWFTLPF